MTTHTGASQTGAAQTGAATAPDTTMLDSLIAELQIGETRWGATSVAERIALLASVRASVALNAAEWTRVAARDVKGLSAKSPLIGEEWTSGPYAVITALNALITTLAAIDSGESPLERAKFGRAPGNRTTVRVLPANAQEAILFHGFNAEVWMPPKVTPAQTRVRAGLGELNPTATGGVGLVLGAGNIMSIPPLDVLYELLAHNRVVLLKLNPVTDAMKPVFDACFAPLIEAGVLRIVTGGGDVGSYLAHHAGITHVHITGSAATHDVVVFGPSPEGRARKAAGSPLLTKEITSELGGVSPVILIPGEWTKSDLRFQAEHVATQRLHNGGYNCIAGQIVVLSSEWPQKNAFLDELRGALDRAPVRPAWYPGSDGRLADAEQAYPSSQRLASGTRLLVDITAGEDASTLETTETFSPVLGVIELPGVGQAFFDTAVDTVNRDFLCTLGANVIVDPRTKKKLGAGLMNAIAELRYGSIAINTWTGFGFLSASSTWGAFPGHTITDVQSGRGIVHNAMLIDGPERTVVTGPFRPFPRSMAGGEFALFPKPPWFVTARTATRTGRLLTRYAAHPSWAKLPAIFASAFRA